MRSLRKAEWCPLNWQLRCFVAVAAVVVDAAVVDAVSVAGLVVLVDLVWEVPEVMHLRMRQLVGLKAAGIVGLTLSVVLDLQVQRQLVGMLAAVNFVVVAWPLVAVRYLRLQRLVEIRADAGSV